MHNADHSKMNISKDSHPGYELQLEDILSDAYIQTPPLLSQKAKTEMP